MSEYLTPEETKRRLDAREDPIMNFSTEQACLILVNGIKEIEGRFTMIYDLMQFITWETEDAVREVMARLIEQRKVTGCNCGCRGDWEPVPEWERTLEGVPV